jgi:hypothetical protein
MFWVFKMVCYAWVVNGLVSVDDIMPVDGKMGCCVTCVDGCVVYQNARTWLFAGNRSSVYIN